MSQQDPICRDLKSLNVDTNCRRRKAHIRPYRSACSILTICLEFSSPHAKMRNHNDFGLFRPGMNSGMWHVKLSTRSFLDWRRMAVLAECDICGNQHRVKDGLEGSKLRCRDCGVEFKVPEDQEITADRFYEEDGRLHVQPDEPAPQWGAHSLILCGACLMTLAFAVVIGLFFLLYRLIF